MPLPSSVLHGAQSRLKEQNRLRILWIISSPEWMSRRLLETARRRLLLIPYLWLEAQLCQNGGLRQATGAGGGGRGKVLLSPLGTLTALTRPPAAAFALRGTVLPAASSPGAAQGAESHPGGEKRRACPPAAKSASTPGEGESLILCVPSGDREEAARTTGDTARPCARVAAAGRPASPWPPAF